MYATDYISVSNPEFERIEKLVQQSYPNSCLCTLEKVNNENLLNSFEKYVEKNESEIWEMFHGTNSNNVDSIVQNGFKKCMNQRSVYGVGTYFAKNAKYSYNYMTNDNKNALSYMILANVAVHDFGKTTLHNNDKTIIVATEDDQIYPKYVIGFHKDAI